MEDWDDLSDMPKDAITREEWERRQAKQTRVHTVQPQPKAPRTTE